MGDSTGTSGIAGHRRYHDRRFGPRRLWALSHRLHAAGWIRAARLVKTANYVLWRAFLPPEVQVPDSLVLGHLALGLVVHQHVDLGKDVLIWQGAQLVSDAGGDRPDSRIVICDGVEIGAGATVVGRVGRVVTVHQGARVGAGAVVTRDVLAGATVVGPPATVVHRSGGRGGHP